MNTDMYVAKHQVIRQELADLIKTASSGVNSTSAAQLAETVNKLTGVLKMHLASEDTLLYPELLKNPDEKVRTITREYMREVGNLSSAYTQFHDAYNTPSKITADTTGFVKKLNEINNALTLRMDREEKELYTF